MTARLVQTLARAGLPANETSGRAGLFEQVIGEFQATHGRAPAWAWWVPGRIEIFGKHTDYAGGRSLVAAVPRGFALACAARQDEVVTARDARWQSTMAVSLRDSDQPFAGWANYVAVVARRLASNFPGARLGADLVFASDLPRAAGVSSSSALVVAVASALVKRAALNERPEWLAAIHGPLDLAGYLGAVENGLTFGALTGTSGVGTHGGSEDHTAILASRPGHASAFSYVPVHAEGEAELPPGWTFVVLASGVEAAKAGAARGRYNRASLATRALLEIWREGSGGNAPTLAAALRSAPGGAVDFREAVTARSHRDFGREELLRRLDHFAAEDARVPAALEAIATGDEDVLGELAAASQRDAERLLQNQVPQTVRLASVAREEGAFAASSFGAGFGGSVWALVAADAAQSFADRWRRRYLGEYPSLTNVTSIVARPGPASFEVPLGGE